MVGGAGAVGVGRGRWVVPLGWGVWVAGGACLNPFVDVPRLVFFCAPLCPRQVLCWIALWCSSVHCTCVFDGYLPALCAPGCTLFLLPAAGFMLDRPLVLIYHCLLSHPFAIVSWAEWARVLAGLDARDQ